MRDDISTDVVIDVDHHSDEFNLNEVELSGAIRRKCPVAWNERYGGFWFATGYDAVAQIAKDGDTFAHKYEPNAPDGIDYLGEVGVPRPEGLPPLGIGEIDGPYHRALRRELNPRFSPQAVKRMRPFMVAATEWFIDQRISDGEMDLVLDYASPIPAILTMKLMGLPLENWQLYSDFFHATIACPESSDEYREAISKMPAMMEDLLSFAARRRADPQDDLTSLLVQFEFDGQNLTDPQILDIFWNLIGGGVDTTTSLVAWSLRHLAQHQDLRRRLIDEPNLYKTAPDEFLRYYSVNQLLSRTVTNDVTISGQLLRRNDQVLISWLAANHDENEFENADEVVLDRERNRHLAFGLGPHRCIGSHLAREMFEVMVRGLLERIPDYEVGSGPVDQYLGNPAMTGLVHLPAAFTPGESRGTERPF